MGVEVKWLYFALDESGFIIQWEEKIRLFEDFFSLIQGHAKSRDFYVFIAKKECIFLGKINAHL